MLGLPSETEEDLLRHRRPVRRGRRRRRAPPPGHRQRLELRPQAAHPLPVGGADADRRDRSAAVAARAASSAAAASSFKWHDARLSYLEGHLLARRPPPRRACCSPPTELGCRFDGWSEHCRFDLWEQALRESGIDPDLYLRRRLLDEVAAVGSPGSGVTKTFLQRELAAAFERTLTPDCSIERCTYCGACDFTSVHNVTYHPQAPRAASSRGAVVDALGKRRRGDAGERRVGAARLAHASIQDGATVGRRRPFDLRAELRTRARRGTTRPTRRAPRGEGNAEEWLGCRSAMASPATAPANAAADARPARLPKLDRARFLGSRELDDGSSCARAGAPGLPLAFSSGPSPAAALCFGPALPVGVASDGEYLDVDLTEPRGRALRSCTRSIASCRRASSSSRPTRTRHRPPTIDRSLLSFTYAVVARARAERVPLRRAHRGAPRGVQRGGAFSARPSTSRAGRARSTRAPSSRSQRALGALAPGRDRCHAAGTLKPIDVLGRASAASDDRRRSCSRSRRSRPHSHRRLPTRRSAARPSRYVRR